MADGAVPGVGDLPRLGRWLHENGILPVDAPPAVRLIAGGRSNLTYLVDGRAAAGPAAPLLVLRRPPLGHVLPTAHDMGREYQVLSALRGTAVPVPPVAGRCTDPEVIGAPFYVMEYVPGLVLRTAADGEQVSPDQARQLSEIFADMLAAIHGVDLAATGLSGFGRPNGYMERQLARWQRQWELSSTREMPGYDELTRRLAAALPAAVAAAGPGTLVHGDYRLDNMLFGAAGADRALTVVDWQTVSWGPALTDLSYFLGCALSTPERREHYDALLRAYHQALGPAAPLSLADVTEGVRRQSFFGVMMAIVSSMLVERTERGDRMFMTMLQRHCDHVLDTDALAALPDAVAPEALRPSEDDELSHAPTAEPLWGESWYADFADAAQGLGGWFRIGLVANQQTAWVHALLCGPDMATVAVDAQIPLLADPWSLRADTFEIGHSATAPLQTYRVDVRARAQAYPDPSALLRGEPGTPVEMTMNLVWTTDGAPYKYRLTTRYEIPCTVSGTITVNDTTYRLNSVPGQRDHSWGVRDWWSMDWIWSALHLHDGTHLHGVNIRIPGAPNFSVGYVQDAERNVIELQTLDSRESFGANGLPRDATVTLNPGEITADVDVCGHAPVRLVAADGRVSQFPRVWATVRTADGRTGVGWVEWNRNLAEKNE
ncbi:MAG TPA: phosphotransferase [Mycobacterium sp.]|nr:phosphotransferase [Mycobacterium sp.]HTX97876.1 phosphotransferase [Mycobacterium sp.]